MNKRIAIAEDNPWLLKSILERLAPYQDLDVRFTARDGKKLTKKVAENQHLDLILMDIEMPDMDGIAATAWVKNNHPQIKVVMITVIDDDEKIFEAIQAGADGYLMKEVTGTDLYNGIEDTLNGGSAMTPSIALKTLKLLRSATIPEQTDTMNYKLSEREVQVLEQLSTGLSYTKIADNLFLSPSTVRKHIENIYRKLQVHSKLEAVEKAKRERLI